MTLAFETTHWSLVAPAHGDDSTARQALARLCEIYWYPLYAYIRRRGTNPDDARDITQGFLASFLERHDFENLRRDRGRFRSFLLASLQHFIANDNARRQTLKRGGGISTLSLALEDAEGRYLVEPPEPATPQTLYERRWALTVIERVLHSLRREWEAAGKADEFDELKACLLGDSTAQSHAEIAERLSTTEGAVRVAVHRLRKKFQKRLRGDIAETVLDASDVDEEIRYLIRALNA